MNDSNVSSPNSPKTKPTTTQRIILAVGLGVFYGVIIYSIIWDVLALKQVNNTDAVAIPLFIVGLILLPMAVASLTTTIGDPRGEGQVSRQLNITALTITILIAISVILFREGGICVVMAAPFLYGGGMLGTALTTFALRRFYSRQASRLLIVLPFIGLPIEPNLVYPDRYGEVRTVIEIAAPPEIIWAQTVEIPNIQPKELSWTFSHGIVGVPRPEDARIDGNGVGAVRNLRWGSGIKFEEVITGWNENRFLSWDFRFGPNSIPPAVEAHIKVDSRYLHLQSGDYRLEPAANGKTRLTLTTRYRIATPINAYCDWWGQIFLSDFHGIVLDVIRKRSEKAFSERKQS